MKLPARLLVYQTTKKTAITSIAFSYADSFPLFYSSNESFQNKSEYFLTMMEVTIFPIWLEFCTQLNGQQQA